jgi:hypothetical protein
VQVLDSNNEVLDTLYELFSNEQTWGLYQFNLSKCAGQPIRIRPASSTMGMAA